MQPSPLDRCFDILECLAPKPNGLSLGDICEAVQISKSLGHRALALLVRRGYVTQNETTRDYLLTFALPVVGFRHLAALGLTDILQPILDGLAQATGEYVSLGVVDGESLIWVTNARGAQTALRYEPVSGPVVRLHSTASGRAWLATLTDEDAMRLVLTRGLDLPPGYGKNAVRSVGALMENLRTIRRNGYAVALESGELGIHAIAIAFAAGSPPSGDSVGTLSIAGPAFRLSPTRLIDFLPQLQEAAQAISMLWPLRSRGRLQSAILEAEAPHKRESA
jgi:IclR family acetate operon transcriptional repressor